MTNIENATVLIIDAIEEGNAPNVTASQIHVILRQTAERKTDFSAIVQTVCAVYKAYKRNQKRGFVANKYDIVFDEIRKHYN